MKAACTGTSYTLTVKDKGAHVRQVCGCIAWTRLAGAILLLLSQAGACRAIAAEFSPEKVPIRLALTFVRANPVTNLTVGSQRVQAVVDTGGDGAVTLSKEVIEGVKGVRLSGALVTTNSYGEALTKPRFRVPAVTIGGRIFHDMPVVQAPTWPAGKQPPVPNGIGRQFLSGYFVVVDFPDRSVTLLNPERRSAVGRTCGGAWIPMEHTHEADLVVGKLATQAGPLRLLFDTGATYSVLSGTTASRLRLQTVARGRAPVRFYESRALSASGQSFGPLEFVVFPLKLPRDFDGMLGLNFFMRHVVCLDYQRRRVFIR